MTRERLVNWAVLAALAGGGVWVASQTYWDTTTITAPLRGEALRNPFYSVERVSRALGIDTQRIASLRELPADAVLFIGDTHGDAVRTHLDEVQRWVERGGRLAVPVFALWGTQQLQSWSGIAPAHRDPQPLRASPAAAPPRKLRRPGSSVTDDATDCVDMAVAINGVATGGSLSICVPKSEFAFVSRRRPEWSLSNERGMQMLRVAVGKGSVSVIGPTMLLGPVNFLRHDAAESFIEVTHLVRGDRLLLFSALQAEPLLAMLWRLAAPILLCCGLAALLAIWRNLPRFGPPAAIPATARRSLAEQLRASARFAWRTGNVAALHAAVLHALDRSAAQRAVRYATLDAAQRAALLARRTGVDPAALAAAMTATQAGGAAAQRAAIALLDHVRRALELSTQPLPSFHER